MKRKKVHKSLAELSADSLGTESAKSQETKPPEPQVLAQALRHILQPDSGSEDSEDQEFRHWGINE